MAPSDPAPAYLEVHIAHMPARAAPQTLSIVVALACLLTGCTPTSSQAAGPSPIVDGSLLERSKVTQLIARYEVGAPATTTAGRPWGAQCVAGKERESLDLGRQLGARMRVVLIDPPVTTRIARVIALQMQTCPKIEWVEADVIRFTIP